MNLISSRRVFQRLRISASQICRELYQFVRHRQVGRVICVELGAVVHSPPGSQ